MWRRKPRGTPTKAHGGMLKAIIREKNALFLFEICWFAVFGDIQPPCRNGFIQLMRALSHQTAEISGCLHRLTCRVHIRLQAWSCQFHASIDGRHNTSCTDDVAVLRHPPSIGEQPLDILQLSRVDSATLCGDGTVGHG